MKNDFYVQDYNDFIEMAFYNHFDYYLSITDLTFKEFFDTYGYIISKRLFAFLELDKGYHKYQIDTHYEFMENNMNYKKS